MKVLLIEDHPALAEVSCNVLRELFEHQVELARSGAEALATAPCFCPDLVLVDLNLPDMDGYEIAATLRADTRFDTTILVALTGVGNLIDQARAAAAGFDAQFTKPMDFAVLGSLTRRHPQEVQK